MLRAWQQQAEKYESGEISKEEYDQWRYQYPELDTYNRWAKVPSEELDKFIKKELKKRTEKRAEKERQIMSTNLLLYASLQSLFRNFRSIIHVIIYNSP